MSMKTSVLPDDLTPSCRVSKHPSYKHVLKQDLAKCSDLKVKGEKGRVFTPRDEAFHYIKITFWILDQSLDGPWIFSPQGGMVSPQHSNGDDCHFQR